MRIPIMFIMTTLVGTQRPHRYNRVLNVGLPCMSGRYFVVLGDHQTLVLAELKVQDDGSHAWSQYHSGTNIQESLITMWKSIEF
jgi:hypothetical protein